MLDMIESRTLEHTWRLWEPSIIYVHHQSAPFPTRIWLPPFAEPIATHAPFLLSREVNMIGMAIAKGLEERGQVGATHMGTGYDAWYPGYIDYLPMFKNIAAFWTETQGNGAAPRTSAPEQIPADMRRPQALYPSPWLGGTWRLRDAVEYMQTASLSVLEYASRSTRNRCCTTGIRPAAIRFAQGRRRGAVRVRDSAGPARSRRRRRAPAAPRVRRRARVAVDVAERPSTNATYPGRHVDRARPTRNSPRSRAKCSTCRSTRRSGNRRTVRSISPTTRPGGRCRSRWASRSCRSCHSRVRTGGSPMKLLGPAGRTQGQSRAVRCPASDDAAPFDSVPGHRLRHESERGGDRPAARPRHRDGTVARRQSSARTTRFARSIRRGKPAARVQFVPAVQVRRPRAT